MSPLNKSIAFCTLLMASYMAKSQVVTNEIEVANVPETTIRNDLKILGDVIIDSPNYGEIMISGLSMLQNQPMELVLNTYFDHLNLDYTHDATRVKAHVQGAFNVQHAWSHSTAIEWSAMRFRTSACSDWQQHEIFAHSTHQQWPAINSVSMKNGTCDTVLIINPSADVTVDIRLQIYSTRPN